MPDIDLFLNPNNEKDLNAVIETKKAIAKDYFRNTDMITLYPNLFKILSSAYLPCSSGNGKHRSLIKECKIGKKKIDCSKIFQKVPTDSGMCCAMNMKSALRDSEFSELVKDMQKEDGAEKMERIKLKPGKRNGLRLTVDLHSSTVSHGSVYDDYQAFKVFVGQAHEVPTIEDYGLTIEPGHEHFLAISNTILTASKEVKRIKPKDRKCYFPDESNLDFFHHYTFSNCLLECLIKTGQDQLGCTPWYLPRLPNSTVCDPWTARNFTHKQTKVDKDTQCSHCLPDCQRNSYLVTTSAVRFG